VNTGDRARDWRTIRPVPAGLAEQMRASRSTLTDYLTQAFEDSFGTLPREINYETFPDGLFAGILVDGRLTTEHNVWGVMASTGLRDAGVSVNVFVRASSELDEAEREYRDAEKDVVRRIRGRRTRP
jgi:hypothetical protein